MKSKNKPIKLLFLIVAIVLVITSIGFILIPDNDDSLTTSAVKELTEVTFRISWLPGTLWAPYLVAQDKGFYAAEGLKVKIFADSGSTTTTKLIAAKTSDFGRASGNTVLTARTKGMPIKVVAVFNQESPAGVISFKDSGITSPKDLEGKKVASDPKSSNHQEFITFCKKNDVDLENVNLVPAAGDSQILNLLMNGNVDAAVFFLDQNEIKLENNGFKENNKMYFKDYGVHIYSHSLIVHEDLLQEQPDLIRKFVKATVKGWEYSIEHPEEAIDSLVKHYPEMDKTAELVKFKRMQHTFENEITQEHGFGYQTKERWEEMQDMLYDLELIDKKIDVTIMYTNEFLE